MPDFDEYKAEAFASRMLDILNNGGLALMVSIGHRTGLFDTMNSLPPTTSRRIAEAGGLNERYVREWLGAMVVGGLVEYDPGNSHYLLPPEHAAVLTREASPNNMAVFTQYIPLLGTVEDKVVECFSWGGGVPYSEFKHFQQVMAEDSGQTVVAALLDHILPLVPGLDRGLKRGINVLDVGCGSGRAVNLMARSYPNSRFTGYDISEEAISKARKEAAELGLANARFEVKDVSLLTEQESFDFITAFDAIHDQVSPDKVLAGIYDALRPNGVYLMQDIAASSNLEKNIDHPVGPLLYTISCMHCMTVSLAVGGPGLGAMWGEETAKGMLKYAGFKRVEVRKLDHDFQNNFYVVTK